MERIGIPLEEIEEIVESPGKFWDYISSSSLNGGTLDLVLAINDLEPDSMTDEEVLELMGKVLNAHKEYSERDSSAAKFFGDWVIRNLINDLVDVTLDQVAFVIESRIPDNGGLRFLPSGEGSDIRNALNVYIGEALRSSFSPKFLRNLS